ncbi:MAG: leucine-rich repeat domain-containing protein [Clostridia bacterium]|nr:leucine-rich repeat domain-containing protein [Clostridia bacterium]
MLKKYLSALAVLCAAWVLLVGAGALRPARAEADRQTFETYQRAVSYVKKNQPMELELYNIRFKPRELLAVYNAMPKGAKLTFTTTWGGYKITDKSVNIDLTKSTAGVTKEDLVALVTLCPKVKKIDNSTRHSPSNDVMVELMAKYPHVQFEWMVHLGGQHYCATSASAYSTFNQPFKGDKLTSKQLERLQYCKNLKALDLGHNSITTLDFLKYLPDLELLIVGDNRIKDITPVGTLKHLKYVELFSNDFTDISPLANCTELLDLNICYAPVHDFSPIDNLTSLERFWATMIRKLPESEKIRFQEVHPNVEVDFVGSHATTNGWRKHPRYTHYIWCLKNGTWIPFDEPLPTGKK